MVFTVNTPAEAIHPSLKYGRMAATPDGCSSFVLMQWVTSGGYEGSSFSACGKVKGSFTASGKQMAEFSNVTYRANAIMGRIVQHHQLPDRVGQNTGSTTPPQRNWQLSVALNLYVDVSVLSGDLHDSEDTSDRLHFALHTAVAKRL